MNRALLRSIVLFTATSACLEDTGTRPNVSQGDAAIVIVYNIIPVALVPTTTTIIVRFQPYCRLQT